MQKLKDWFWGVVLWLYTFILRIFGEFPSKRENDSWQKVVIEEEVKLAKCFKESLMTGLPHRLRALNTYFSALPEVDEKIRNYIFNYSEEKVRLAASPYSKMLLHYGLKPLSLVSALNGLELLLSRLLSEKLVSENDLVIDRATKHFTNPLLRDEAIKEIERMVLVDFKYAGQFGHVIMSWIAEVLENKPLIFERFSAVYENEKIRLIPDVDKNMPIPLEELDARWIVTRYTETQLDLSIEEDGPDA